MGWTWDGDQVIYEDPNGVSVVDTRSSSRRLLDRGAFLMLSPDRRKLLVEDQQTLWVVDIGAGQRVAINRTINPSDLRICGNQSWSSDGKRLTWMYRSESIEDSRIAVVNTDGTGLTSVADGYCPQWSPDGEYLGYIKRVSP